MSSRVLVLHGPNLSLGPADTSVQVIDAKLSARAQVLGAQLRTAHANGEEGLLDALVESKDWLQAVIVNPTSIAPIAYGLAEALALLNVPAIEVQLGSPGKGKSALKDAVESQIHGKGIDGYVEALNQLAPKAAGKAAAAAKNEFRKVEARTSVEAALDEAEEEAEAEAPAKPRKTIGRGDGETPIVNRAVAKKVEKTIVRQAQEERPTVAYTLVPPPKTLGRKPPPPLPKHEKREAQEAHGILTRARVREQIAERLAGTMTPAALATWARARWADLQAGTPAESGQRERLEEVLQTLIVAAAQKASDQALIELMVQLER
jgi:3-dehydroquinate dehydratase II